MTATQTIPYVQKDDGPFAVSLSDRIRHRCIGEQRYYANEPLSACENEHQELGWWATFHAQADAEYIADAIGRGVSDQTIYETLAERERVRVWGNGE